MATPQGSAPSNASQGASRLRQAVERDGYVVVPAVVPAPLRAAVVADIYAHIGANPADPATWYPAEGVSGAGMVEMHHYQSMWDTRQHPAVHAAFSEIFGTPRLWVTIDRTNFKPPADPAHPGFDSPGFIHWDTDITRYPNLHFGVQGVLALTDTTAEMGGFQCVPEIYRELEAYLARRRAAGVQPDQLRHVDITGYPVTPVPLRAGDLVIWSTLLPHGNGRNTSGQPRLAQYISMHPAPAEGGAAAQDRVAGWRYNRHPDHPAFPGDPREIEEKRDHPSHLTPLGRRLLGLDPWE